MDKSQKDIVWILIDTLMIDFLNLHNKRKNYIEKLLLKGKCFTNVITAEKFTLGSLYALGSGLYGTVNGMNGIDYNFSKEKYDVLFIGDYLKKIGYKTFHYSDRRFRHFPSSGIDTFELGPYNVIQKTFGRTYDTPGRRNIIKQFNKTKSPKFIFLHMFVQHDLLYLIGRRGRVDTSIGYKITLNYLIKELSTIINLLNLSGDELLVISTDHGAVLDKDFMKEEVSNGTSMREGNLKTFCSFISSDITPEIITSRCSTIDILPTIFDLGNLPTLPVQGRSLISSEGTTEPICEAVEVYKFPFNRSCSSAYSIYKNNNKMVIKKNQDIKLYKIDGKNEIEIESFTEEQNLLINELKSKIVNDLSQSPNDIKIEKIKELKPKRKSLLLLNRDEITRRIVLFVTDYNFDCTHRFIDDMKSQIEHYFDIHFFDLNDIELKNKYKDDHRFKFHESMFEKLIVNKILESYEDKPLFIGLVKTVNEYYEDFLYELCKKFENNPNADISYAPISGCEDNAFLIKYNKFKIIIDKNVHLNNINVYLKQVNNDERIYYKHPLGKRQKNKITLVPMDKNTIELLKTEGIDFIEKENIGEKITTIIACTDKKNIPSMYQLSNKYNNIPVFIDIDSDQKTLLKNNNELKIIKRKDYRYWVVLDINGKQISDKIWWLWQAFEYIKEIDSSAIQKTSKIQDLAQRKPVQFMINLIITKISYFPVINSYPIRKLLYSISIGDFESLGAKNSIILNRKSPYKKNFYLSNLPKK